MLVIPAIDLRGGACVRLRQGDYSQETVFGSDPASMARRWVDEGAEALHIVDLDGAREGRPMNRSEIADIVRVAGVPCQLGGGIRDEQSIRQALDLGVSRVIIGTQAVKEPEWFARMAAQYPNRLVLGLDAKDGRVATAGWLDVADIKATDLLDRYLSLPLAAVVYTDIAKDGMMQGPNIEATAALARKSPFQVIASGGVTTEEDVIALRDAGVSACILGRTLYEGTMTLSSLLDRLRVRSP